MQNRRNWSYRCPVVNTRNRPHRNWRVIPYVSPYFPFKVWGEFYNTPRTRHSRNRRSLVVLPSDRLTTSGCRLPLSEQIPKKLPLLPSWAAREAGTHLPLEVDELRIGVHNKLLRCDRCNTFEVAARGVTKVVCGMCVIHMSSPVTKKSRWSLLSAEEKALEKRRRRRWRRGKGHKPKLMKRKHSGMKSLKGGR